MENKRKIPKRIFSLILVILCTFGIFFVSYIDSFADAFSIPYGASYTYSSIRSDGVYLFTISSSNIYYGALQYSDKPVYAGMIDGSKYSCVFVSQYSDASVFIAYGSSYIGSRSLPNLDSTTGLYYYQYGVTYYGGTSYNDSIPLFSSLESLLNYYYSIFNPTPSPTPTPTPGPTSTPQPTPNPDPYAPGSVPTIPPGEASYTSFFNRLASDAQNAFNAIFLSWQNANNKFYSGLFFIGFPVLLGIIGLVASIFFGDDD